MYTGHVHQGGTYPGIAGSVHQGGYPATYPGEHYTPRYEQGSMGLRELYTPRYEQF